MTKTHTPGDAESCAVFVFTAGSEAFALVQSCASKFPFCWHQTVFNMGASESSAPPDHASGLQPNPHAYSVLCILEVKRCSTLLLVAAFKVGLLHLHHVSAMCRSFEATVDRVVKMATKDAVEETGAVGRKTRGSAAMHVCTCRTGARFDLRSVVGHCRLGNLSPLSESHRQSALGEMGEGCRIQRGNIA